MTQNEKIILVIVVIAVYWYVTHTPALSAVQVANKEIPAGTTTVYDEGDMLDYVISNQKAGISGGY